jgi:hypothetical protein
MNLQDLLAWAMALRDSLLLWLEHLPAAWYWLAFALLPVAGFPISLFYLTALPALNAGHDVFGIGLAWLAIASNIVFSHLLARGGLRPIIDRLLRGRGYQVPQFPAQRQVIAVLAVRVSPLPFPIQNYLLPLAGVPLARNLPVSILIQGVIGTAVMLMGDGFLRGSYGRVLFAGGLLALVVVGVLVMRRRLAGN